jgi:hypothetical protein
MLSWIALFSDAPEKRGVLRGFTVSLVLVCICGPEYEYFRPRTAGEQIQSRRFPSKRQERRFKSGAQSAPLFHTGPGFEDGH